MNDADRPASDRTTITRMADAWRFSSGAATGTGGVSARRQSAAVAAAIVFGCTLAFLGFWLAHWQCAGVEPGRGVRTAAGGAYYYLQFSFSSGIRRSSSMRPLMIVSSTIRGTSESFTPPYQIACG